MAEKKALNFYDIPLVKQKKDVEDKGGPTVADELNARLGMLQNRDTKCKPIRPLVKAKPMKQLHSYRFKCVCSQYVASQHAHCQHTGQIIIDRDVLTKEEHLCFLATPKKDVMAEAKRHPPPLYIYQRITMPACTARVERLAQPDKLRVKEILAKFLNILPARNRKALKQHLVEKPQGTIEAMSLDKALEYMEEEQRLKRVARQVHARRCRGLRKRILMRQRKQIRKIVCVLFEEMKDFLLNDQFIIDENSPLCSVIFERLKDFTDQEFYTTSNLREYQRILANNLTVWINKFISNLNIHLAPPGPPQRRMMHAQEPDTFVPVADFIPASETEPPCEEDDIYFGDEEYTMYPEDYVPESAATEDTLRNADEDV